MTRSIRRSIFTVALAAGLALGTAGTASAQVLNHADQRGDVKAYDLDTDQPVAQSGTITNGDILRTTLGHGDRRISVRVKFADLRRAGDFRGDLLRVVTNEGVRRDVMISAAPGMWAGQAQMTRPNGNAVRCNIAHKIDYDNNVVTLSFPRSCVSDPRWVRLGSAAVWMSGQMHTYWADDALMDGGINPDNVRLSPRLRRG